MPLAEARFQKKLAGTTVCCQNSPVQYAKFVTAIGRNRLLSDTFACNSLVAWILKAQFNTSKVVS